MILILRCYAIDIALLLRYCNVIKIRRGDVTKTPNFSVIFTYL